MRMKSVSKLSLVALTLLALPLAGCSTLDLDSERAADQRKQELCREIATRDLPHCAGGRPDARDLLQDVE